MQVKLGKLAIKIRQNEKGEVHAVLPGRGAWGVARFGAEGANTKVVLVPVAPPKEA